MIILTLPNGTVHRIKHDNYSDVYYYIGDYLCDDLTRIVPEKHIIAADAEGWSELACIGESYSDPRLPGLSITIE